MRFLFIGLRLGENTEISIPMEVLVTLAILLFLMVLGVIFMAISARKQALLNREKEKMEGQPLLIISFDPERQQGLGKYKGELWKIEHPGPLEVGEKVRVVAVEGLSLRVERTAG